MDQVREKIQTEDRQTDRQAYVPTHQHSFSSVFQNCAESLLVAQKSERAVRAPDGDGEKQDPR